MYRSVSLLFHISYTLSLSLYSLFASSSYSTRFFSLSGLSESDQEALDLAIFNRCKDLIRVITLTTWKYLRRGLFVTHKLTIATQLTFKVMLKDGLLDPQMVDFLIMNDEHECEKPATLWWLPQAAWNRVKFISKFPIFKDVMQEMEEGR